MVVYSNSVQSVVTCTSTCRVGTGVGDLLVTLEGVNAVSVDTTFDGVVVVSVVRAAIGAGVSSINVGRGVGSTDGLLLGAPDVDDSTSVGWGVGSSVGEVVVFTTGDIVGFEVGIASDPVSAFANVGVGVGSTDVGCGVGFSVELLVGPLVGDIVGSAVVSNHQ